MSEPGGRERQSASRKRRGWMPSFWQTILIYIGIGYFLGEIGVLLYAGFVLLFVGGGLSALVNAIGRWRKVVRTATSTVRGAAQGFVEISGAAVPASAAMMQTAPFSGGEAVLYTLQIEIRETRRATRGGKSENVRGWWDVEKSHSPHLGFLIESDGHSCGVFSQHFAHWDGMREWRVTGQEGLGELPPGALDRFPYLVDGRPYRIREWALRPGDKVCAIGEFRTYDAEDFPFERSRMQRAKDEIDRYGLVERLQIRLLSMVVPKSIDEAEVAMMREVWEAAVGRAAETAPSGERRRLNWLI